MKDDLLFFTSSKRWLASLIVIAAIAVCVIVVICAKDAFYLGYDATVTGVNEGWSSDEGETYSLSDLPIGPITLHRSVEDMDLSNMRFCMKSVDTFFQVLADGEIIYVYRPEQHGLLGKSYGMYSHAIPIPVNTRVLTVVLTPIFDDAPPALLGAVVEDPGMFIGDLFVEGISGFGVCLLILILGVIMIITDASSLRSKSSGQSLEIFTLGVFAVLVAIWSVNDTLILQVITQSPAIVRMLNYISLIFMPYFIGAFIASATNKHRSPLLPILFTIVCINFVLNISLTVTGISDYFELVKISQAVVVITLAMAIYFVVSAIKHKQIEKRFLRIFLVGVCLISVGGIVDLIIFRVSTNVLQSTSFYARMGSLLFLMLIGLYLIQENRRAQIENSRALEHFAYTDGLTGMKNRLAFNKVESSLPEDADAKYMIIQFDINDLKTVNDLYGHAEGDRHITAAAGIIRDSIRTLGDCYRVGGDEFIAIITGDDPEAAAHGAIRQIERLTAEYNTNENPPVKLDIAYGMAMFTVSDGDMEKSVRLADQRMYECKRIQKLKNGAGS